MEDLCGGQNQCIRQAQAAVPAAQARGFHSHGLPLIGDAKVKCLNMPPGFFQLARSSRCHERLGQRGGWNGEVLASELVELQPSGGVESVSWIQERD